MKPIRSKKIDLPSSMIAFLLILLLAGWAGKFLNGTCTGIIIILILVFTVIGFRQWRKGVASGVKPRLPAQSGDFQAPPAPGNSAGPIQVMRPAGYDPEQDPLWGLRYAASEAEILKQVTEISVDKKGLFMKNAAGETIFEIILSDIRMIFPGVKLSIVPQEGKAIVLPPWTAKHDAQIVASLVALAGLEKKATTEEFRGEMVEKIRLSKNFRDEAIYGWSPGKKPVTFQIEINSLEKVIYIGNPVTAALDDLDFVVQPFDKAA